MVSISGLINLIKYFCIIASNLNLTFVKRSKGRKEVKANTMTKKQNIIAYVMCISPIYAFIIKYKVTTNPPNLIQSSQTFNQICLSLCAQSNNLIFKIENSHQVKDCHLFILFCLIKIKSFFYSILHFMSQSCSKV